MTKVRGRAPLQVTRLLGLDNIAKPAAHLAAEDAELLCKE